MEHLSKKYKVKLKKMVRLYYEFQKLIKAKPKLSKAIILLFLNYNSNQKPEKNQMGNLLQTDDDYDSETCTRKSKLKQTIKISRQQEEKLIHLIRSRGKVKCQHLCTAIDYNVSQPTEFDSAMLCQEWRQLTIFYQDFDKTLDDIKETFPLKQHQVQNIIFAVSEALSFLIEGPLKTRHGDICPKMICRKGNIWKLIDNSFIRQGITAYEKVLLGQDAFISPFQMDKIRHGFVRESPPLKQADDVFALGMTCMQMMSGRPSKFCYKQTYVRFNEKQIEQRIVKITELFEAGLVQLVRKMINLNQEDRPKIKEILNHPIIGKYGKKTSLKNFAQQRDSRIAASMIKPPPY